ncbi:hypothetical protein GCM10010116_56110 [Microbispora rosea subsp. aerata]|nr:hypothetical protein GCM10010116_56110 [Microbispora rosea subsp. aerata]GIH56993.1 hypothetical protein Mro02_39070 [Microbispora rosea subsp. aerata]GLJ82920.1 hypothetical protein GCM10017588_16460 [Microbispora rosea subsp. aerata]
MRAAVGVSGAGGDDADGVRRAGGPRRSRDPTQDMIDGYAASTCFPSGEERVAPLFARGALGADLTCCSNYSLPAGCRQ